MYLSCDRHPACSHRRGSHARALAGRGALNRGGVRPELRVQGDRRGVREENREHGEALFGLVRELLRPTVEWCTIRSLFFSRHRLPEEIGRGRIGGTKEIEWCTIRQLGDRKSTRLNSSH